MWRLILDPFLVTDNKLGGQYSMIVPYKAVNIRFITLYGIITESLSAYFTRARYNPKISALLKSMLPTVHLAECMGNCEFKGLFNEELIIVLAIT